MDSIWQSSLVLKLTQLPDKDRHTPMKWMHESDWQTICQWGNGNANLTMQIILKKQKNERMKQIVNQMNQWPCNWPDRQSDNAIPTTMPTSAVIKQTNVPNKSGFHWKTDQLNQFKGIYDD